MGQGAGVDRTENLTHTGIRSPGPSSPYLVAIHNVVQRKNKYIARLHGSVKVHRLLNQLNALS